MQYGFVYVWFDRFRKKYCVGSHHGPEDDGYITSTGWMMRAYQKRQHDFKRKIVARNFINDSRETRELERRWLQMIKPEELKSRYYNLKRVPAGGNLYEALDESQKVQLSIKLSASRTGEKHHKARAVIVQGVQYSSVADAKRALGWNPISRVKSKSSRFVDSYYVDEGPPTAQEMIDADRVRLEHIDRLAKENSARPKEWHLARINKSAKTRRSRNDD